MARKTEGPGVTAGAFTLSVAIRRRTGKRYAAAFAPAIQVWAMETTEQ